MPDAPGVLQRLFLALCALLLAAGAAPARAQLFPLDAPADSPFWWTLDDSLTPEALRRELQDPEAHRRRYREAAAAGLERPLSEARLSQLKYYSNPLLAPFGEPLWHVFHFYVNYMLTEDGVLKARSDLACFGVSAQGIEVVLARAAEESRRFAALVEEIGPLQVEYVRMIWAANGSPDGSAPIEPRLLQAEKDRDVDFLASRSGRSAAEVRRLLEVSHRDFSSESAVPAIAALHDALTHDDWQGLRRFLADQFVHRFSAVADF